MAEPKDISEDPSKQERVITIVEDVRQDGHGALPRLKPAPLGSLGGPARIRLVPKPQALKTDGED